MARKTEKQKCTITDKLLPCPFCGSPAEFVIRSNKGPNPFHIHKESKYAIACSSTIDLECYLYSGHDERTKHSKRSWDDVLWWYAKLDDAVKAWQTRWEGRG